MLDGTGQDSDISSSHVFFGYRRYLRFCSHIFFSLSSVRDSGTSVVHNDTGGTMASELLTRSGFLDSSFAVATHVQERFRAFSVN